MVKKIVLALLLIPVLACAWEPTHPITVSIGFAPGSGNELAFRSASAIVEQNNPKVSFIIENKPGADTVVSLNQFILAAPDGYTIAVPSHMSLFVTNDIWEKSVKKFEWDSFINVLTLGKSPLAVIANVNSQVNTPKEFARLLQTTTKPINIAIGGGAHQMAFEYIMLKIGGTQEVKSIRYQGPLQAATAVAGNQTEFGIMPIAVARPLLEAKKIKLIGLTSDQHLVKFPNAPKMSQVASGIDVNAGWLLSLPPNTPKDIIEWYQREFSKALTSPEYQKWASDNLIVVINSEFESYGVKMYAESLRKTFKPIADKLAQ